MNYATIETTITYELSNFTLCFFVKMVLLDPNYPRKCVFSYQEHSGNILVCIFRENIKIVLGEKSRWFLKFLLLQAFSIFVSVESSF